MTDRPPDPEDRTFDPDDEDRPGSDPGAAYDRWADAGQVPDEGEENDDALPGAGDVYRSGS